MREVKHTPGPWCVEFDELGGYDCTSAAYKVSAGEQHICTLDVRAYSLEFTPHKCIPHEGAEANARLIAAAPEMHDALAALLSVYTESTDDDGSPVVLAARDALSKARALPHADAERLQVACPPTCEVCGGES